MTPEQPAAAAWEPDALAAAAGEAAQRLAAYAEAGLLARRPDGQYDADALTRLRLIRFARDRGVDERQLAAAIRDQGDLLGIFEGLGSPMSTPYTLDQAAGRGRPVRISTRSACSPRAVDRHGHVHRPG